MEGNRCSIDVNRKIVEFIDSGRSFAVALILKVEGSTPRKAGVKAVIDDKGKIWGTLGGGQVEAEAQRRAVEVCKSKHPVVFDMNLYGADRADEGSIDSALSRYGQRLLLLFFTTRIDCDGQNIVRTDPIGLTLGPGLRGEYHHDKLAQKQNDISWFYLYHKKVKYNNRSRPGFFAEKLPFTTYGVTKFQA